MRTRKIPKWVCGAVLCCAVPAAFCQTLSGSLAEGTVLSPDASQGESGMGSIGGRSQVSASASSTMNTDVAASMDAEDVSGAVVVGGASGAGAGPGRLDFRISPSADKPVNGRLGFGMERGLAGERSPELKRTEISDHAPISSARTSLRNGTMQAGQRLVPRAGNGSANQLAASTARQSRAAYSKDFPDSTKGTALLSPPDSTGSPLDWTPSLNYGFSDFTEQPFLEPSLRGRYSVRRPVTARTKAPIMGGIPSDALTYPDFSTSVGDSLRVHVPDPLADLASH